MENLSHLPIYLTRIIPAIFPNKSAHPFPTA
jgi:hypothetical protein